MKNLIVIFFCLTSINLFSQKTTFWIGGTPGKENVWKEAKNWSDHKIPDENTHVIIKEQNSGHNAQPIIKDEIIVASIELQLGGILRILKQGKVKIDGRYTLSKGLLSYGGTILNDGTIELFSLDNFDYNYLINNSLGNGILIVNDRRIGIAQK